MARKNTARKPSLPKHRTKRIKTDTPWHWIAPVSIGAFITAVVWVFSNPSIWFKIVAIVITSLGAALTVFTCPWIKSRTWRNIAAVPLIIAAPVLAYNVWASYKQPTVYLDTAAIVDPGEAANVIALPNDGSIFLQIQKQVKTYGYKIGAQPTALRVNVTNVESASWRNFSFKIKIHYEMRPALPISRDWSRINNIEQVLMISNCRPPLSCHEPIAPGGHLSLVLENQSDAYAAIELPKTATVSYVGEADDHESIVNISGDTLLPLAAQVLPPFRKRAASSTPK